MTSSGIIAHGILLLGDGAEMARRNNPDQFQLRLPSGMRERIKLRADRMNVSMNTAIVAVLDDAFPAPTAIELAMDEHEQSLIVSFATSLHRSPSRFPGAASSACAR
ncbi:MAG: Arc family DNA-binding protein [Chitinophagaceae bacterium]|nr:MAG: Arc family DNA-binding protein [Chitinophagaceae bacterium]